MAVPESAGQTELALPSSEAPPAPQNTSGGLFSGLFPGTAPLVPTEQVMHSLMQFMFLCLQA